MPSLKLLVASVIIFGATALRAGNGPEFPIGSVIQNFALPQADSSGRQTALVKGKRATVVSPNQLKIEDLNVELYNAQGKPETVITATHIEELRRAVAAIW